MGKRKSEPDAVVDCLVSENMPSRSFGRLDWILLNKYNKYNKYKGTKVQPAALHLRVDRLIRI